MSGPSLPDTEPHSNLALRENGLTQILCSRIKDREQQQFLDTILRNAKRLRRLTEDILDVSKIESKTLDLKKESFN